MAKLTISVPDESETREVELGPAAVTLGRDDKNSLVVKDDVASRRHATIEPTADGFVIRDLGSSNGTWVNRERVQERLLKDGDEITVGRSTIVYSDPPESDRTVRFDPAMVQGVAQQPAAVAAPPVAAAPPVVPPPSNAPAPRPQGAPPPAPVRPAPPPPAPPERPAPPARPAPAPRVVAPPPPAVRPPAQAAAPAKAIAAASAAVGNYAGFGIRLVAYLVDMVILGVILGVIIGPTVLGSLMLRRVPFAAIAVTVLGYLAALLVGIGYLVYYWGKRGATPGKKLFGLRIVRLDGVEPLGYGKAFLRLVGYMVSGALLYVGFIMILFTEKKQGLHDMIAGTVVVRS